MASFDIAIVGGGMVGLTLVRALRPALDAGARLVLIDPAPQPANAAPNSPSFDDRATALSAFTQTALDRLDVGSRLEPHASRIDWIEVSDRGHAGYQVMDAREFPGHPFGAVVANRNLGLALWQACADLDNVDWRFESSVDRLKPEADHQQLTLTDGEVLTARQVFLCDGGRSPLADRLGIGHRLHDYHARARVASLRTEEPHRGRAFERFTEDGPIALLPFGDYSALVWTVPEHLEGRVQAMDQAQQLAWLNEHFGQRLGRITDISETADYPLVLRQCLEPVRHRLMVLGNSAATLHPVAGQGFNLAIRSVLRAADRMNTRLVDNLDPGDYATLNDLAQAIDRDQSMTARLSDGLVRTFASNRLGFRLGRNLGLGILDRHPQLNKAFTLASMGLLQGAPLPEGARP
ncbi:FAD-dependent monooxygenase [Saccharospirillum salsuginis]|uniref:2-octaprenyl-6-methoxyphenyl hydroxylase n=1 Tax=Saccharospirillum salsuginis TaxID=418750 RepID=A0A918K415_9GAMM|nr:FAD-dependent monooxygenase [Saccharospirillum salsuginis]GGX45037.1 2-octaprenyl-6-methoxyphenyl hydroxylase [Saccharospirillum salsuginis]